MGDLLEKILLPGSNNGSANSRSPGQQHQQPSRQSISEEKVSDGNDTPTAATDTDSKAPSPIKKFNRPWNLYLEENKVKWKELNIKGTRTCSKLMFPIMFPFSSIKITFYSLFNIILHMQFHQINLKSRKKSPIAKRKRQQIKFFVWSTGQLLYINFFFFKVCEETSTIGEINWCCRFRRKWERKKRRKLYIVAFKFEPSAFSPVYSFLTATYSATF